MYFTALKYAKIQTRIVGFQQSIDKRKDGNPTGKTAQNNFNAYGWQK